MQTAEQFNHARGVAIRSYVFRKDPIPVRVQIEAGIAPQRKRMNNLEAKAIEEEIDGVLYKVWPVPFSVGRPALVRVIGLLSPVLSSMLAAKSKQEMGAALFSTLPASMSDADLVYFAKLFGDASQYKNSEGNWAPLVDKVQSAHFEGRYLAYFQWLALAMRCNFAGFFSGLKSVVKDADPETKTP